MRILYLIGSIISVVVILILGFENIAASCNGLAFFFWSLPASITPTFILFGASFVGVITGAFITLFLSSLASSSDEDEEYDENFEA